MKKHYFYNMNLIKNIFIIYIIFLAVYPCTDKYSVVFENSLQNKASLQHNISQDIENDFCNPFCICNCDRQITLISLEIESFQFLDQLEEIKTPISSYKIFSFSNFYQNIWQPPKIS